MKRAAAALVVAAALTGLVLVLGQGSQNSARASVKRAAGRSVQAGSSRFTMSWQVPTTLEPLFPRLWSPPEIQGTMDYVHHRGRIGYGEGFEYVFDGDITYAKWPMPWRDQPAWVRYPAESSEPDPLDLQERALRNPIGLLDFLTGAGDDVHALGSETVRGSKTTHYEGTLDLQKVLDQAPPHKRAELQDTLNFLSEDEPKTVPFGLWTDDGGVAHRLRIDQPGGAALTIDYYDFGLQVEFAPPPATEIISAEDLAKELTQHEGDSGCDSGDAGSGNIGSSRSKADAHAGKGKGSPPTSRRGRSDSASPSGGYEVTLCVSNARTE